MGITGKKIPKINVGFQLMFKSYTDQDVNKIKEIECGRILFLYDDFFVILNLKTKKQICKIKSNFEREHPRYYDMTLFFMIL